MCGRFVGFRKLDQLQQYFPIDVVKCEATANYNVAPSRQILAIARLDGANVLARYHWGLVPLLGQGYRHRLQNDQCPGRNRGHQAQLQGGI